MTVRTTIGMIALSGLVVLACGGEVAGPTDEPGEETPPAAELEVTVSVSGDDPDLNGYAVTLNGSESQPIGGVRDPIAVTFEGLAAGAHELELADATSNCSVAGENPRTVTLTEGQSSSTSFEVICTGVEKVAFLGDFELAGTDVFVMHADGQDRFAIPEVPGPQSERKSFAWSPDGTRIAYQLGAGGITLVDEAGRDQRSLTGPQSFRPAWSPDGARIAFVSSRTGDLDVWIVSADGTGETNLTADPDAEDLHPGWAPDGSRIVFQKGDQIWTMAPDGSDKSAVTGTDLRVADNPSWSPDGGRIAFLGRRDGETVEIWIVAPDGSDLRRLTTDAAPAEEAFPRWSPDGTRIAFESDRTGDPDIWVMDADGSNLTNLTENVVDVPSADRDPGWSSDGAQILFTREAQEIWIVDADGSNPRRIAGGRLSFAADPAWRPPR